MIKNDYQLDATKNRITDLRAQLDDAMRKFSGIELELIAGPIKDEIDKMLGNVQEYESLRDFGLDSAVVSLLGRPTLIDSIGQLLAKLRIAAGLTQEELAERLGWHQSNLSRFESTNYSSQTVPKIVEYASSLDVWLHVVPSLAEAPSSDADTEIVDSWDRVLLSVPVSGIELPFGYGLSDNTLGTVPPPKVFEAPQNTEPLVPEEVDREYEYA